MNAVKDALSSRSRRLKSSWRRIFLSLIVVVAIIQFVTIQLPRNTKSRPNRMTIHLTTQSPLDIPVRRILPWDKGSNFCLGILVRSNETLNSTFHHQIVQNIAQLIAKHEFRVQVLIRARGTNTSADDLAAHLIKSLGNIAVSIDIVDGTAVYAEMVAGTMEHFMDIQQECSWIATMDPTRIPMSNDMFSTMVNEMNISGAYAASCTTFRFMPNATEPRVFDRGFNVSLGQFNGKTWPMTFRNMFGFSSRDERTHLWEPAHLVSPYCLVVGPSVIGDPILSKKLSLPTSASTVVDSMLGSAMILQSLLAIEELVLRQRLLSEELSKISVVKLKSMPTESRTLIRQGFNTVLEAQRFLKEILGEQWASAAFVHLKGPILEGELRVMLNCHNEHPSDIPAAVLCMTGLVAKRSDDVHRWFWFKATAAPEEVVGWSISMVLHNGTLSHQHQGPAVITSSGAARLEPYNAPKVMRRYLKHGVTGDKRLLDLPSSVLLDQDPFWRDHSTTMEAVFPQIRRTSPLRIVWDSYCCRCCGFSNEIVHLIYPLQKRMDVRTTMASECFCPGFPLAVDESMNRMYMKKDEFPMEHITPDEIVIWVSHTDPTLYKNDVFTYRKPDYIVGRSMFEFTRVDKKWINLIASECDEVWVPADFVAKSFIESGVDATKLKVIPEAIDVYYFDPAAHDKLELPPPPYLWNHFCNHPPTLSTSSNYKFFSNFKWEGRKGWETLLTAYFTEFRKGEPVSLYILTHIWLNGEAETYRTRHNLSVLKDAIGVVASNLGFKKDLSDLPHLCVIADDLSEGAVAQLYRSTDSFVLPTRGEGWGLPTMQAMSMGMAVISTAWGGQTAFLREDNAFPIPILGVEDVPRTEQYHVSPGMQWAIPSLNSTRHSMRLVMTDRTLSQERGRAARRHIVTHFSEEAVADLVEARLREIHKIALERRLLGGWRVSSKRNFLH